MSARWQRLNSPLLMGHLAPLTLRSLLLGVLVGGGSWGVVSWAIAWAAADALAEGED